MQQRESRSREPRAFGWGVGGPAGACELFRFQTIALEALGGATPTLDELAGPAGLLDGRQPELIWVGSSRHAGRAGEPPRPSGAGGTADRPS